MEDRIVRQPWNPLTGMTCLSVTLPNPINCGREAGMTFYETGINLRRSSPSCTQGTSP